MLLRGLQTLTKQLGTQAKCTVIVTGGASGYGEATVRWMADRGRNVVIADVNKEKGQRLAQAIKQTSPALFVCTDVTDPASWSNLVKQTLEEFGDLHVLVNNAGSSYTNKPALDVTEADFDKCFDTNVKSIYHSVAAVVPHFLSKGHGIVVNDLVQDLPGASKFAVNGATKSLAAEYAASGIRFNAVCPGPGRTPLLPTFLGKNPEAAFIATCPMGRLAEPEDIAPAIGWLASDEAKYVTGVLLEVDGGRCI